jgi:hypothetical protein
VPTAEIDRTPRPRCFARQARRRFKRCSEKKSARQVGVDCHLKSRNTGCPVEIISSLFVVSVEEFSNSRHTGTLTSETATFLQIFGYPLFTSAGTYPEVRKCNDSIFWTSVKYFLAGMKAQLEHVVEEYCWAITQAVGRSCCRRSSSIVLEFWYQLDPFLRTYRPTYSWQ